MKCVEFDVKALTDWSRCTMGFQGVSRCNREVCKSAQLVTLLSLVTLKSTLEELTRSTGRSYFEGIDRSMSGSL